MLQFYLNTSILTTSLPMGYDVVIIIVPDTIDPFGHGLNCLKACSRLRYRN